MNIVQIPKDVVNPIQYKKMLALEKHPTIRNTIFITSEGTEINIAMLPHMLRKRIENLSPKEQEDIMELKRKYNVLRAKISTAKALAFGRAGCLGGKKRSSVINKLSPFEEDIVELLGRMFTITEVVKIMGEDNGVLVNEDDVKGVLKKYIVDIEKKREEFRNRVSEVRLYNKRPRLEELSWMYSKMKSRFIALNGMDAYNSMLRTLEQIRKESEGDLITINGAIDINIEATIKNHIQKEILKTINLRETILGRVAARMGFDTKKLVAGLHNSFYAKFVDIGGDFDENAIMKYPSQSAYDFTKIEQSAGKEVVDITAEEVTPSEKSTASSVKDLFLSKIRKQKEDLENRKAKWNANAEIKEDDKKDASSEKPIKRGIGRGKDKILPSKTKNGIRKGKKINYYNGEKKKK